MKNKLKYLLIMGIALFGCAPNQNRYYNVAYIYDIDKSEYNLVAYDKELNKLGEWHVKVERTYHVYPYEQFYRDNELVDNEYYVRENKLIFYHYRY